MSSTRRAGDQDPESHARRAESFGSVAAAYAQHRPDYPPAAIRWALAPLRQPDLTVIDVGAGTGKLTAQLADPAVTGRGSRVIAVEPDPRMRAELRRLLPDCPAVEGTAERIPLASASADAVFAGQAGHWFDLDLAMPELARVLRPGGVLAGLWNGPDDREEWVAGLYDALGVRSGVAHSAWARGSRDEFSAWLGRRGRPPFGPPQTAGFAHAQPRTAASLLQTLRTHSNFVVGGLGVTEATLAGARRYLASRPETADREFTLPLYTHAVRIVRAG